MLATDYHGGSFAGESNADYLFSENALAEDTRRVHDEQQGVSVLKPDWLAEVVLLRKAPHDVAVGPFLILPHYCDPFTAESNLHGFCTPERDPPSLSPPPVARESRLGTGFGPMLLGGDHEDYDQETEEVEVCKEIEVGELCVETSRDCTGLSVVFDKGGGE